ncbi:MAG: site-specific integrase, partial [Gammaproteobacteria bacterium]|nr:site-specific integrase [Gammaproteobacteria bacterium]
AIGWEHIHFVPEGVTILIPRSKTDQEGEGQSCAIPYGSLPVCPVTALKQWQQISGFETGAVFRAISKGGKIADNALSAASITPILQSLAKECGLMHPEHYSGHSLRRGFATAASQQGVTLRAIMRQGRWRHEGTVQGYIEEGQQFQANAADVLLQSLAQPRIISGTER